MNGLNAGSNAPRLFVFLANELDQFRIQHDMLAHGDGPRLGVGFGVVDGDIDFQMPEVRTGKRSVI